MFEEPKDMFAGTDREPAAPAPVAPPAPALASQNPSPIAPPPTHLPPTYGIGAMNASASVDVQSGGGHAFKILLIVAIVLGVLGVSGFFAYRIMVQPAGDVGVVDAVPDTGIVSDTPSATTPVEDIEAVETPAPVTTTNPATLLDSDGDGLTNARELEVGTSVTKADTDGDGLGDREEVEVYGTDPRNPDTDGDGFLDGQEVSSGYNPNGDGRLFAVPQGS